MKTAEDVLKEKGEDIISVTPDTTIYEAVKIMVEHKIGAIVIKEGDRIVGIWTERDLTRNVISPGFNIKAAKIGDYMVTGLKTAPHTDTIYKLFDKFLGLNMRHLIIEKEGKYIGILSMRDVKRACLIEKDRELKELNEMVSWEYYENWRWKKKK